MKMKPINKHTVLKKVRNNGVWRGYIAPSNVSAFHIKGGWHIGMRIEIHAPERKGDDYIVKWEGYTEPLEQALDRFKYYNCNSELGYRVRFWEESVEDRIREQAIS
jgi:hypothetical protein